MTNTQNTHNTADLYAQKFLVGGNLRELIDSVLAMPHYTDGKPLTYSIEFPSQSETLIIFENADKQASRLTLSTERDNPAGREYALREIKDKLWRHSSGKFTPTDDEIPDDWKGTGFYRNPSETIRTFLDTVCDWLPTIISVQKTSKDDFLHGKPGLTVRWKKDTGTYSGFFPYENILNDQGNKYLMERMITFTQLGWTSYPTTPFATGGTIPKLDSLDVGKSSIGYLNLDPSRFKPSISGATIQTHTDANKGVKITEDGITGLRAVENSNSIITPKPARPLEEVIEEIKNDFIKAIKDSLVIPERDPEIKINISTGPGTDHHTIAKEAEKHVRRRLNGLTD